MRISIIMFSLLLAVFPPCTFAEEDVLYEVLQYKCDTKGNYIQVELLRVNEALYQEKFYTKDDQALANTDTWSPWQLVDDGGTGRYIKDTKTIKRSCRLSDGTYIVEIGPKPCNYDTLGRNGAMMMAWAKVSKGGKQLARTDFGTCTIEDKITTKLQIRPGQKPIIEQKSAAEYFNFK